MNLRLDWCSYEAAKFACLHWHYAKKMPVSKSVRVGVWEDSLFIGVVMFTSGSAGVGAIHKKFGLGLTAVCELQRVALKEHKATVTRIISIALKMLKKQCPKLELVVSYADPMQGHSGIIYKAGNWVQYGMSASDKAYDFGDKILHSRSVSESGFKMRLGATSRVRKPSQAKKIIELAPKYRFLYPIGEKGKLICNELRAKQATCAYHAQSGGAAPTRTLQPGAM